MQLNPLSIEPVAAGIAIAQRRGRFEEVADFVEEAVERQPENPDVWLRAYSVQQFVDDAPARIASVRRMLELDPHESRIPFDTVAGDVAAQSASATGTPLVVEVLPAAAPAIGPPAPDARPADRAAAERIGRRHDRRAARIARGIPARALTGKLASGSRHRLAPQRSDARVRSNPSLSVICGSQPSSPWARAGSIAMCCTSPRRGGANSASKPLRLRDLAQRVDELEHRRLHAEPDVERAGGVRLCGGEIRAHDVAHVHVVARLLAVAEDRGRARRRSACRRRSRSRRPRRAGPGGARRRCRSGARRSTARAGARTGRSSPPRRTSTGRRAPRAPADGPRAPGRMRPSP